MTGRADTAKKMMDVVNEMSHIHEILPNNVKNNDWITYSFLIIKGQIHTSSDVICKPAHISISLNTTSVKCEVVNGQFKGLIELRKGSNLIILKYCSSSLHLQIFYDERATKLSVLPLYIICAGHDGKFQAPEKEDNSIESALKRVSLGVKLIQSLIAEKMFEENFNRKTFRIQDECKIFHSKLSYDRAKSLSQENLWECIAEELISSKLDSKNIKFIGILSSTWYYGENHQDPDILGATDTHVALGGGGLALFGSGCLYTWPENFSQILEKFKDSTPVNRGKFMDDSHRKGTLGACFSTTLGAVLHELCHCFDLGHTAEGVMGRGFHNTYKVFLGQVDDDIYWSGSGMALLAYHKWLNNYQLKENTLKFNDRSNCLTSTAGLRVIEVRKGRNLMVLFYWTFITKILKFQFQIPENCIHENSVIFVEDNVGNTLKIEK